MAPQAATARPGASERAEQVCRSPEQQQLRAIYAALEARDHAALRELAFSRFGFCSSEVRRAVWPFLLGLSPEQAVDGSWRRLLPDVDHEAKESRVIKADVQRSVYSWDVHTGIRKAARNQKRVQLSEVMHAVLQRHTGRLAYFQGFHDIALVFLEVGTASQAFNMVERLALFHLSDQLCMPFDQGLAPLLGLLFCLLEFLDAPLAEALREADCAELHFAVPWVLTWFAHSLPRLHQQVMRLYDCLLAAHPAMVLYFSAALLMRHRASILAAPRELPEVTSVLQQLPLQALDVEDWAAQAWRLVGRLGPEELLQRAAARRRALPSSSPLLHFPHPWMPRGSEPPAAPAAELWRCSPIYAARPPRQAAEGLARLLQGLGMAGAALAVAWALSPWAWALQ
mmetsp:Transcript_89424/g.277890  ORF Transcript_89424/g.277890 Transcript_89424/m.277890 type:complete len:398 (+) Transcript_89424:174-1367(+)